MSETKTKFGVKLRRTAGALACSSALGAATLRGGGMANAKDLVFGYVPASLEYPYNVNTAKGFEEAAKAAGVKTVVIDPRGSVEKQGNALDDLLSQKVDAIGFLPLDSVVAESFVDKITAAKSRSSRLRCRSATPPSASSRIPTRASPRSSPPTITRRAMRRGRWLPASCQKTIKPRSASSWATPPIRS